MQGKDYSKGNFLIHPHRRDILPYIASKKRGVESRRSKHSFEPDPKKVLDLISTSVALSFLACLLGTASSWLITQHC